MWEYLFESSAWSIGGLVIGYFFGRTERQLLNIKRKVAPDEDD